MKKFAIVDLETTGTRPSRDKITEIAIILHDGTRELDRWSTLVNPECRINTAIEELTGINDELVAEAPKFYEVAKHIVEYTEGYAFVAHNVRFDYTFLREEFTRLGFTYTRRQLCTLQLARKSFPGKPSYSLGRLCKSLKIEHARHHRAMADAEATAILLERCLAKKHGDTDARSVLKTAMRESLLPGGLSLKKIQSLPQACGVYYFINRSGRVVYVGKSQNIRRRVMEHFGTKDEKGNRLHQQVHSIRYELTGSELVALLHESYEIKRLMPSINRAQRRRYFPYVLHRTVDEAGVFCVELTRPSPDDRAELDVIAEYGKLGRAKGALQYIQREFGLCGRHVNLERGKPGTPCFHYHLKSCLGVCAGHEDIATYNERVLEAVSRIKTVFGDDFFIIDEGRTADEEAVVLIEDGRYRGYGYRPRPKRYVANPCQKKLRDVITPYPGNPETARIIRRYLNDKDVQVVEVKQRATVSV